MKQILIILMLFCSSVVFAQNIKRPDSYNYNRALEAMQNNNEEEAIEYFQKELKDNPNNGYALVYIAAIMTKNEEYGKALNIIDLALKYIPKKDKEYIASSYTVRSEIYTGLEEYEKALADISTAIKENPNNEDSYERRANIYYYMDKYDLSDKDFRKIIALNPSNTMGYMGIGRNANAQKRYNDAIKEFNYVNKLAPKYSSAYSFRAESYMGLKQYDKAINDIINALSIDRNQKAFNLMLEISDYAKIQLIAKLKIQKLKNPNSEYWPYCLAIIYEHTKEYRKAIEHYKQAYEKEASDIISYRLSKVYRSMEDFSSALEHIDNAIAIDSTDFDYVMEKTDILSDSGDLQNAIIEVNKYIKHNPEIVFGYYIRALIFERMGNIDAAIEDYTMAIALYSNYTSAYLRRANTYDQKGDKKAAEMDYKKVIELDTIPNNYSYAEYAYLKIGQIGKAIDFMNRIIANDPNNAGNYYDAACLYSLMGKLDKSIEYLQIAFEKGYRSFTHIEIDKDLNALRKHHRYKELINKYKKIFKSEIGDEIIESNLYEEQVIEVPFTKENGVYKVKCTINNLPLYFVFDTGASDVSISSVEASFMIKNGYLKASDIIGQKNYMMANGDISTGTIINLQNVNFEGLDLNNIRASVVHNQEAPLLLGQSILSKLGNVEIDNAKRVLRIRYKKKIKKSK